jgi:hypothetical protein
MGARGRSVGMAISVGSCLVVACGPDASSVATISELELSEITAGANHSCGISIDGEGYCWGANGSGALGAGQAAPLVSFFYPVGVVGGYALLAVEAGQSHGCGLTTEETVVCWGSNIGGALGISSPLGESPCDLDAGTGACVPLPVRVDTDATFSTIAAGAAHSCGLDAEQRAFCWGSNLIGQLGNCRSASIDPRPSPVCGSLRFARISGGTQHSCGISVDGLGYCWGGNDSGALGSTSFAALGPVPVAR